VRILEGLVNKMESNIISKIDMIKKGSWAQRGVSALDLFQ